MIYGESLLMRFEFKTFVVITGFLSSFIKMVYRILFHSFTAQGNYLKKKAILVKILFRTIIKKEFTSSRSYVNLNMSYTIFLVISFSTKKPSAFYQKRMVLILNCVHYKLMVSM